MLIGACSADFLATAESELAPPELAGVPLPWELSCNWAGVAVASSPGALSFSAAGLDAAFKAAAGPPRTAAAAVVVAAAADGAPAELGFAHGDGLTPPADPAAGATPPPALTAVDAEAPGFDHGEDAFAPAAELAGAGAGAGAGDDPAPPAAASARFCCHVSGADAGAAAGAGAGVDAAAAAAPPPTFHFGPAAAGAGADEAGLAVAEVAAFAEPAVGDTFLGSAAGDTFFGSAAGETFFGSAAGVTCLGSAAGDTFLGSAAGDTFFGSATGETFFGSAAGETFLESSSVAAEWAAASLTTVVGIVVAGLGTAGVCLSVSPATSPASFSASA